MKSHIGTVLRKELLDIIRDKRSIITALVIPIVLYPMMFALMGTFINSVSKEAESNTIIAIQGSSSVKSYIMDNVLNIDGISLVETDDPESALDNGDIKVILKIESDAQELLEQGKQVELTLVYDENKSASSASLDVVASAINAYNERAVEQKLSEMGISLLELKPFSQSIVTLGEITGNAASNAGFMLSMLLPMLVTVYLSVGGMSVAMDLFAGEKERHTMEALLCTRAGRNDILIGKFSAVVIYSIVSVIASVSGIIVAYVAFPDVMNMGAGDILGDGSGFVIEWQAALFTLAAIMTLAMTFAAIQVIISCWSRTVKEAGTYSSFIMIISYVPVFSSMMMQAGDFKLWSSFVPVFNTIGCMKMVLAGISDYFYMGLTLVVSITFLCASLLATRLMFKNENIMLRG